MVSLPCVPTGAASVCCSPQRLCRIRRTRARAARVCEGASAWRSYLCNKKVINNSPTVIFIIYPSFPESDNPCRDSRELVLNNSLFSLKMRKPGYREYFSNFHQISINEKYDNKRLPKHFGAAFMGTGNSSNH